MNVFEGCALSARPSKVEARSKHVGARRAATKRPAKGEVICKGQKGERAGTAWLTA